MIDKNKLIVSVTRDLRVRIIRFLVELYRNKIVFLV